MVQRYLFFGSKKKYGTIKIECRIGYFSDWVVCGARVRLVVCATQTMASVVMAWCRRVYSLLLYWKFALFE
jgi:hypothetical protein